MLGFIYAHIFVGKNKRGALSIDNAPRC